MEALNAVCGIVPKYNIQLKITVKYLMLYTGPKDSLGLRPQLQIGAQSSSLGLNMGPKYKLGLRPQLQNGALACSPCL